MPSDCFNNSNAPIPESNVGRVIKAAIYARQSRIRGIVYSSCQNQIDMCRQLAAGKNWAISHVFSDEGYSSETINRPQMSQLIAAIETGEVRHLVVYSLDRLTRRMLHFQQLLDLFERHSVTLAVVNDPSFNVSATGRLARVRTIIRRGSARQPDVLRIADLEADFQKRRVTRGGQKVELSPKEFALLFLLMRRSGEVLSRTLIAEQVWDINFNSDTNVVDVHIRRLRSKVDDPFALKLIHTVRGAGYVLEERT